MMLYKWSGNEALPGQEGLKKIHLSAHHRPSLLIHTYLDSIDTPRVMRLIRELVSSANVYLTDRGTLANARLLQTIAHYLTFLLRVFGVVPSDGGLGFPVEQEGTTDQVSMSSAF